MELKQELEYRTELKEVQNQKDGAKESIGIEGQSTNIKRGTKGWNKIRNGIERQC